MQVQPLGQDREQKSQMLSLEIYDGQSNPIAHIEHCLEIWKVVQLPSYLWTLQFFHYLGTIPKAWYMHEDTRRQETCWKTLQINSSTTSRFLARLLKSQLCSDKSRRCCLVLNLRLNIHLQYALSMNTCLSIACILPL
jgi:hypothetical protein